MVELKTLKLAWEPLILGIVLKVAVIDPNGMAGGWWNRFLRFFGFGRDHPSQSAIKDRRSWGGTEANYNLKPGDQAPMLPSVRISALPFSGGGGGGATGYAPAVFDPAVTNNVSVTMASHNTGNLLNYGAESGMSLPISYRPNVTNTISRMEGGFVRNPQGQVDDLSLAGLYTHFQIGGGKPLNISMSSVDFGGATQRELGLVGMHPGDVRAVQLFRANSITTAGLAFGRVNMVAHGNNQFSIASDNSARFDFTPLIDRTASLERNVGNVFGASVNYNIFLIPITPIAPVVPLLFGGPFDVIFHGTTTIPR